MEARGILEIPSRGLVAPAYSALLEQKIRDPKTGQMRATDFFIYSQNFLPLAALATRSLDIQIQSDSDFLAVAAVAVVRTTAAGAAAIPDRRLTVLISDSGSGRNLFDRVQDFDDVFGTAQRPAWWPVPKLMRAAATISVQLTDLQNQANNVRVAFWGIKIFGASEEAF